MSESEKPPAGRSERPEDKLSAESFSNLIMGDHPPPEGTPWPIVYLWNLLHPNLGPYDLRPKGQDKDE